MLKFYFFLLSIISQEIEEGMSDKEIQDYINESRKEKMDSKTEKILDQIQRQLDRKIFFDYFQGDLEALSKSIEKLLLDFCKQLIERDDYQENCLKIVNKLFYEKFYEKMKLEEILQ